MLNVCGCFEIITDKVYFVVWQIFEFGFERAAKIKHNLAADLHGNY
jgi:hypothetical protein